MAIRWVISPVVMHNGMFSSKPRDMADNGRALRANDKFPEEGPEFYPVNYSVVTLYKTIPPTLGEDCLSFVRGKDFTTINDDPECVTIFEDDYEDQDEYLKDSPANKGWNAAKTNATKKKLTDHGVEKNKLKNNDPVGVWIEEYAKVLNAGHVNVTKNYVAEPEDFT